jgi:hypothetical protein
MEKLQRIGVRLSQLVGAFQAGSILSVPWTGNPQTLCCRPGPLPPTPR